VILVTVPPCIQFTVRPTNTGRCIPRIPCIPRPLTSGNVGYEWDTQRGQRQGRALCVALVPSLHSRWRWPSRWPNSRDLPELPRTSRVASAPVRRPRSVFQQHQEPSDCLDTEGVAASTPVVSGQPKPRQPAARIGSWYAGRFPFDEICLSVAGSAPVTSFCTSSRAALPGRRARRRRFGRLALAASLMGCRPGWARTSEGPHRSRPKLNRPLAAHRMDERAVSRVSRAGPARRRRPSRGKDASGGGASAPGWRWLLRTRH